MGFTASDCPRKATVVRKGEEGPGGAFHAFAGLMRRLDCNTFIAKGLELGRFRNSRPVLGDSHAVCTACAACAA